MCSSMNENEDNMKINFFSFIYLHFRSKNNKNVDKLGKNTDKSGRSVDKS